MTTFLIFFKMVLKSNNVFQLSIFKKLSIVLYCVLWYVYVHINKKLSYR